MAWQNRIISDSKYEKKKTFLYTSYNVNNPTWSVFISFSKTKLESMLSQQLWSFLCTLVLQKLAYYWNHMWDYWPFLPYLFGKIFKHFPYLPWVNTFLSRKKCTGGEWGPNQDGGPLLTFLTFKLYRGISMLQPVPMHVASTSLQNTESPQKLGTANYPTICGTVHLRLVFYLWK